MSIMNNIAAMFRPTQQVAPIQQQQPAAPMSQANPGAAATVPPAGTSNPTATPPEPANPLDNFKPLWETDPKAVPAADPLAAPLFNGDPNKIAEAASKMDFLAKVPQDVMAKAMSGDAQSFAQVIQFVAQQSLSASAQLSAATIEQGTRRNNERLLETLPQRVRDIQLSQMQSENPVLQHPATQPFLNMVRSQIQAKNPGMSPQQIQKEAESHVLGLATAISATQNGSGSASSQGESGSTDWDIFINS